MRQFQAVKRDTCPCAPAGYRAVRRLGLPPQYITILALAAQDPEKDNVLAASTYLQRLVSVWRICATKCNQPRALAEVQLPWLIHCLAHHPDYAWREAVARGSKASRCSTEGYRCSQVERAYNVPSAQRCLDFFISACIPSCADSIPLMRHMCDLTLVAADQSSAGGRQVHVLAALAHTILDLRSEGRDLPAFCVPRNLCLPAMMFSTQLESAAAPRDVTAGTNASATDHCVAADAFGSLLHPSAESVRFTDHVSVGVKRSRSMP